MLFCWNQTSAGSQRGHRNSIWGWRRCLSTQVWLLLVHQFWCGGFLRRSSPVVQSSQSGIRRKKKITSQSTYNHWTNVKVTQSPAYIHPVALPGDGGDGPVQASLHLPLDERVVAVNGHHVLLQHWSWGKQGTRQRGQSAKKQQKNMLSCAIRTVLPL